MKIKLMLLVLLSAACSMTNINASDMEKYYSALDAAAGRVIRYKFMSPQKKNHLAAEIGNLYKSLHKRDSLVRALNEKFRQAIFAKINRPDLLNISDMDNLIAKLNNNEFEIISKDTKNHDERIKKLYDAIENEMHDITIQIKEERDAAIIHALLSYERVGHDLEQTLKEINTIKILPTYEQFFATHDMHLATSRKHAHDQEKTTEEEEQGCTFRRIDTIMARIRGIRDNVRKLSQDIQRGSVAKKRKKHADTFCTKFNTSTANIIQSATAEMENRLLDRQNPFTV